MNKDDIKLALNKMDTTKGIKICELVKTIGHRPSQANNTRCSKILLDMNWIKSNSRQREGKERFSLWFAPVITTITIDTVELNILKEANWSKDSKIKLLEERITKLEQELNSYQTGKIVDIDAIIEQVRLAEEQDYSPAIVEPAPVPQTVSPAAITCPALSTTTQHQVDKLVSHFKARFREPLTYILQNWALVQDKRGMKVKVDFRLVPNAPATSTINQTCSEMFGMGWLKADGSSWWKVSGYLLEVLIGMGAEDQMTTEDQEELECMVG